jgi:hypothetical protein
MSHVLARCREAYPPWMIVAKTGFYFCLCFWPVATSRRCFDQFWISSRLPRDHRWRLAVASSVTRHPCVLSPSRSDQGYASNFGARGTFSRDLCKNSPCNRVSEIFLLLVLIYCFCLHPWYLLLVAQRAALQLFNMRKMLGEGWARAHTAR